jgi:hypothetical protein
MALENKYRKQARSQALQAAAKGGASGAALGLQIGGALGAAGGPLSFVTAPVGAAIGAGLGAVGAGLSVRLQAGREYRELQKMQKQQQKLLSKQEDAAQAEARRQMGYQGAQESYLGLAEPDEMSMGLQQPGVTGYDAYKRRRYGT